MLLGRAAECGRLDELLSQARRRVSGALAICGEPGLGKTALLSYACDRAADMLVLTARAVESESEIPYAALADLLRPILPLLSRIPAPQAAALAGSLATGPPVRGDRFAVAAATLSLLGAAADDTPVLCVVDDAQWMDESSAEALVFAARRLRAEGVLVLLGLRSGDRGADRFGAIDCLQVTPLDERAALELVTRAAGRGLRPSLMAALVAGAGGNPLALLELPASLTAGQRAGREPLPTPLRIGSALERAFGGRVGEMPAATRRALLVTAASDLLLVELIDAAVRRAGGTVVDLEPAEAAGLVRLEGGSVAFRHPLVRSVIYQQAGPGQRRWAHRLLADTLAELPVPQAQERRAWHVVNASVGPDDAAADLLAAAAAAAAARRSYSIAATLFEHSARLTTAPAARPRRLLAGALAAVPAGRIDESLRLLESASVLAEDPAERARIVHESYELQLWSRRPLEARDKLLELAAQTEARDPRLAARMVLSASQASVVTYDARALASAADWASRLAGSDRRLLLAASVLRAFAAVQTGHRVEAAAVLDGCRDDLSREDPLAVEQLVLQAGVCNLALERFAESRELLQRAVERARNDNAAGSLAMQLPWLATLDLLDGRWNAALAEAHEAVRLIEDIGWTTYRPTGLSVLARVEAGMGRTECTEHACEAERAALEIDARQQAAHARAACGLYWLGEGEFGRAVDELTQALELAGDAPLLRVQVIPDLVEASVRAGRSQGLGELVEELDAYAVRSGRHSTLALAARCRGLVDHDHAAEHFGHALEHHQDGTPVFDRARTELCLGELLRRQRRRGEARRRLAAARDVLVGLGAMPWIRRAEADLVLAGGAAPTRGLSAAEHLTPQELQVALAATRGLSNAEVAGDLFLSMKTVEFHLSNAYRKLGVRSRTQLVHRLEPPVTDGSASRHPTGPDHGGSRTQASTGHSTSARDSMPTR